MEPYFFDRDISWLSFNERVLREAENPGLPPGERMNFLSIFSSNLDEFYRVRVPSLMGLQKIDKKRGTGAILAKIKKIIAEQQQLFGRLLAETLASLKKQYKIDIIYNQPIPDETRPAVEDYFYTKVMTYLQPVYLEDDADFFPENNKIYHAVSLERKGKREIAVINIPALISRFYAVCHKDIQYIIFLDDVIRAYLQRIFPEAVIHNCHSFKITRDAEMELKDIYEGDLAEKIEDQLFKRDLGFATRFLYDSAMPEIDLKLLIKNLGLERANKMAGARYHNLSDLADLPFEKNSDLFDEKWNPAPLPIPGTIFKKIETADFLLSPPYESYKTVFRFFNEAALDANTTEIYITFYRVASDSQIAEALISAAKNGKKVTVFVELKARFDEANNMRWAKKMEAAGVNIIYSIPGWKVHAKIALVKRQVNGRTLSYGLMGTGNFNETTAQVYADHIMFTTHSEMLRELELLFIFLQKQTKVEGNPYQINFHHLLIAQFNLLDGFKSLVNGEIREAQKGNPAAITLKLNNLEDEGLIKKLYEASNAGVDIKLVVRSICRLVPGIEGMSENIEVHRIVDRYLEHSRIFIFHNKGEELIFSGSADWMKRNVARRIEVCFPVYDEKVREQLKTFIQIDLTDNTRAVALDEHLHNVPIDNDCPKVQAQRAIYDYLKKKGNR